jgi:hypothetical protein
MGIGTSVNQDAIYGANGLLNPGHQLAFVIGLAKDQFVVTAHRCQQGMTARLYIRQGIVAVYLRLPSPQQI